MFNWGVTIIIMGGRIGETRIVQSKECQREIRIFKGGQVLVRHKVSFQSVGDYLVETHSGIQLEERK